MNKIDYDSLKRGKNLYKHGYNNTKIYHIWEKIKQRTSNPNHINYDIYGGRGIKICEGWKNFISFYGWAISNGYKDDLFIDRIDNNGDYCPNNCRWVTFTQNIRNRSNTVFAELDGVKLPLAEWAEKLNINYYKLYHQVVRNKKSLKEVVG